MVFFHSYVSLPEGTGLDYEWIKKILPTQPMLDHSMIL